MGMRAGGRQSSLSSAHFPTDNRLITVQKQSKRILVSSIHQRALLTSRLHFRTVNCRTVYDSCVRRTRHPFQVFQPAIYNVEAVCHKTYCYQTVWFTRMYYWKKLHELCEKPRGRRTWRKTFTTHSLEKISF